MEKFDVQYRNTREQMVVDFGKRKEIPVVKTIFHTREGGSKADKI